MHQGIEMILIVTEPEDRQASYVEQKLRQRNAQFVRFHPGPVSYRSEGFAILLSYGAASGRPGHIG
jgi:hypothetical protein